MSLKEIESAIAELSASDLSDLAEWFEEYLSDVWDRQIEKDLKAGKLDKFIQEAQDAFKSGKCKPL